MEHVNKKDQSLQILRAIAIVLVLIRHSIAQIEPDGVISILERIIICIHMPAFFVISGYLFQYGIIKYKEQGIGSFIKGKMKHLLVPYLFWYVFLWSGVQTACLLGQNIQEKMIEIGFGPMTITNMLYGLFTYEVYYTEHLWFLYVLFIFFVVHYLLRNIGNNNTALVFCLIIGIAAGYIYLPNILNRCLHWCLFFTLGRCIASNNKMYQQVIKVKHFKNMITIFIMFAFLCLIRVSDVYNVLPYLVRTALSNITGYAIGILGIWLLYGISIVISQMESKKLSTILTVVGNESYGIYLMHNPYIVPLISIGMNKILHVNAYITIISAVLAGVIIPIVLSKVIIYRSKLLSFIMLGKQIR